MQEEIKFKIDLLEARKNFIEMQHRNGKMSMQQKLKTINDLNKKIKELKSQI